MKALVVDYGLTIELARLLARDLDGEVGYFSPWVSSFAEPKATMLGTGLEDEGVKRVDFPWSLFDSPDEPDIWVFPDLYFTDWQQHLRAMGKNVWGSGAGELLELDRWKLHETLKTADQLLPRIESVTGLAALESELRSSVSRDERRFIKLSQYFRGASETYEAKAWPASRAWFEDLAHTVGPAGDKLRFMLQEPIAGDSVEPGIDLLVLNGQVVSPYLLGYEDKDSGLISKVVTTIPDCMVAPVTAVAMAIYEDQPYTNTLSGEMRVTETGECYFIDATCRMPRPGDGAHLKLTRNFARVVDDAARSISAQHEYSATFCCQVMLSSPWAKEHPMHVRFPEELRDNILLYYFYRDDDGEYWTLPHNVEQVVSVVTTGDDLEKVKQQCLDIAKEIEGDQLIFKHDVFEQIEEMIEKGQGYGVDW